MGKILKKISLGKNIIITLNNEKIMSLEKILSKVEIAKEEAGRLKDEINVIAVSKVQPLARIKKF